MVFFYATMPVSGVVGYGIIRTKLHQLSPLWPQERADNRVIWPLRFEFDATSALPPSVWRDQRVVLDQLKARARSGFQEIEPRLAEELLRSLPSTAPRDLILTHPVGTRARPTIIPAPPSLPEDPHDRAQWLLAEIGRLQKFVTDTEYPLENRRLDVAWRRVQRSVPSYVFEVQVGGNLTEAVSKLKQAFELWNSNIYLVAAEAHREPLSHLATGAFHEIQPRLRFIELQQVEQLYQRKRAYRELETQLGILA